MDLPPIASPNRHHAVNRFSSTCITWYTDLVRSSVVNTLTLVPVEDPAAKRQALTSLWSPKMDEDWPASASQQRA